VTQTLQAVADGARTLARADRAAVCLNDETRPDHLAVWTSPIESADGGSFSIDWDLLHEALHDGVASIAKVGAQGPPSGDVGLATRDDRTVAVVPVYGSDAMVGAIFVEFLDVETRFDEHDLDALAVFGIEAGTAIERALTVDRLEASLVGAIRALVAAIDAADPYTCGHSARVTDYAKAIVREMDLPDDQIEVAEVGGLLHDVGKIGVDPAVLHKRGGLADDERELLRRHAIRGAEIVHSIGHPRIREIKEVVRHHHERWDGRGYPDGLAGDQIPPVARAVSIADTYDAITTTRPYSQAMPHERAMEALHEGAGTQFDPEAVAAFERAIRKGAITTIRTATPGPHSRFAGSNFVSISGLMPRAQGPQEPWKQ